MSGDASGTRVEVYAETAASSRVGGTVADLSARMNEYLKTIDERSTADVVRDVEDGMAVATAAVASLNDHSAGTDVRRRLVFDGGLATVLLEKLSGCETKTFAEAVLCREGATDDDLDARHVVSPADWLAVLANTVTNGTTDTDDGYGAVCLEAARSIGPLVRCMSDEDKKELFGSNEHFERSRALTVVLIVNLQTKCADTLPALLEHEGLLGMVVRSTFWTLCDSIARNPYSQTSIIELLPARNVEFLRWTIEHMYNPVTPTWGNEISAESINQAQRERVRNLGLTPIESDVHPTGDLTLAAGLFVLLNTNLRNKPGLKQVFYYMINVFVEVGVMNNPYSATTFEFRIAWEIVSYVRGLHNYAPGPNVTSIDDFKAIVGGEKGGAVHDMLFVTCAGVTSISEKNLVTLLIPGLLQMCLALLLHFKDDADCGDRVLGDLTTILEGAWSAKGHPMVHDAICKVRGEVLEAIREPCARSLIGTAKYHGFVQAMLDVLGVGGICRSCSVVLRRDSMKRCSACKKSTYCGKQCQHADWKYHKVHCRR